MNYKDTYKMYAAASLQHVHTLLNWDFISHHCKVSLKLPYRIVLKHTHSHGSNLHVHEAYFEKYKFKTKCMLTNLPIMQYTLSLFCFLIGHGTASLVAWPNQRKEDRYNGNSAF